MEMTIKKINIKSLIPIKPIGKTHRKSFSIKYITNNVRRKGMRGRMLEYSVPKCSVTTCLVTLLFLLGMNIIHNLKKTYSLLKCMHRFKE